MLIGDSSCRRYQNRCDIPEHNCINGVSLTKNRFNCLAQNLLLVKQYRAEVLVIQGKAKNQNWIVGYKGLPGNLAQFEDLLFDNTQVVLETADISIKFGSKSSSKVEGVSCIETVKMSISVAEFQVDESFMYLEPIVVPLLTFWIVI